MSPEQMRETIDVVKGMAVIALQGECDYKIALQGIADYISLQEEEAVLRESTHKAKVERIKRHRHQSDIAHNRLFQASQTPIIEDVDPVPVASEVDDRGNVKLHLISKQFQQAIEDRIKLLQAIEALCPTMQVPMSRLEDIYGRKEAVRIVNAFISARKLAKNVRESLYQ